MKNLKYSLVLIFVSVHFWIKAQSSPLSILDFGAVPDGTSLNTKAIQNAIDSAAQLVNSGTVVIPKGVFLTGTIFLKSNVTLQITEGGVLRGSSRRDDYQKEEWYALIIAKEAKNIKITGKGTIDGNGRDLAANVESMWRAGLLKNNKPHNRPDEIHRPQIIEMTHCQNVTIEGIEIKDAACWVQTYHECQDMVFKNLIVNSTTYWNNDGLDLVDCQNVLVENCFVNSADDGICLKSHNRKKRCENITITGCTVRSSASAVKFGTMSYGGFKDIFIKKLKVYDTFRSTIALEAVDGGILENVFIEDIDAKNTGNALFIRLGKRNADTVFSQVRNIFIKNLTAEIPLSKPDKGYPIEGPPEDGKMNLLPSPIVGLPNHPIKNVVLENITIKHGGGGTPDTAFINADSLHLIPEKPNAYPEFSMFGELPAWGFFVRHTEGVVFKNIQLILQQKDYRKPFVFVDSKRVKRKRIKIKK